MSTSFSAFILGQEVYKYYQPAFAYSQLEVAISFYQKIHKNDRGIRPCLFACIFDKIKLQLQVAKMQKQVGSVLTTFILE